MLPIRYYLGLDLGQAQDFTAWAVLEHLAVGTGTWRPDRHTIHLQQYAAAPAPVVGPPVVEEQARHYHVRHLERVRGVPYPQIVARTAALLREPALRGCTQLVVDATGVGRAVVDLLVQADLDPLAITITGGDAVTTSGGTTHVPKRDLVAAVAVLLQGGRLKIAEALPDAAVLRDELLAFRCKVSLAGHDSYEAWREADHDDTVLAVALAAWAAERQFSSPWEFS